MQYNAIVTYFECSKCDIFFIKKNVIKDLKKIERKINDFFGKSINFAKVFVKGETTIL